MNDYLNFHKNVRLAMIIVMILCILGGSVFIWLAYDLFTHKRYTAFAVKFILALILYYVAFFQILPEIRESFKEDKLFSGK